MKTNKGFTLIELLVVVLIIGILAAIAVPKYMIATKISQVKSHLNIVRAIYDAQQVFYLANGRYTKDLSELDVDTNYTLNSDKSSGSQNYYHTPFGYIVLNNTINYVAMRFGEKGLTIDFYGPGNPNNVCYRNNEICSKLGGEILVDEKDHWSGTNVYHIDF